MNEGSSANADISRILKMLEDGAICVDEAERLIRAVKTGGTDGGAKQPCGGKPEPPEFVRSILRILKAAARRQRRAGWWRFYVCSRKLADARRKRASEQTVQARVEHLFVQRGLADPGDLPLTLTLDGDLDFDGMARDVMRFALEDEFGIVVAESEATAWLTLGAVVEYVGMRVDQAVQEPTSAEEPGAPETGPEPVVTPVEPPATQ